MSRWQKWLPWLGGPFEIQCHKDTGKSRDQGSPCFWVVIGIAILMAKWYDHYTSRSDFMTSFTSVNKRMTVVVKQTMWSLSESSFPN